MWEVIQTAKVPYNRPVTHHTWGFSVSKFNGPVISFHHSPALSAYEISSDLRFRIGNCAAVWVKVAENWVERVTFVGEWKQAITFGTPGMEDTGTGRKATFDTEVATPT
jgi:hypothetical protein